MTTQITLYKPDSDVPEEHTAIECDVKDGVLSFVIQKDASLPNSTRIRTNVPFLIRQELGTLR